MRTQQSPYEIGADGSNEGGTSHCIVLFCERYWLSGVGGRGCGRRVTSRGKDLLSAQSERFPSIKFAGFRRGIPPPVHVCYKLFWNWNGVVRFVSQDKGFVMWHFHDYCFKLVQIVSLWSLSIRVRIIFTTNELVDRIRNSKSNAYRFKRKNHGGKCAAGQFFHERRRPDLWTKKS